MSQDKIQEDIRHTIEIAKLNLEAWWILISAREDREKIVRSTQYYNDFFAVVVPSLFVTFGMKIASLFDKSSDSINLKSLPGIKEYPGFDALWDRGRLLYRYRSKVLAHRDRGFVIGDDEVLTGLTFNELRAFADELSAMFDWYAEREGIEGAFRFSCEGDLLRLIDDIDPTK